MGVANTLQQGSLHTALAASPGPADTWEWSAHCILVVNTVSKSDRLSSFLESSIWLTQVVLMTT